jgi:F-type H+-transporting ATPase subunit delta
MKIDRKYRYFAQSLVEASMEDGLVSEAKVREVLDGLVQANPRGLKMILQAYQQGIAREIRFSTAQIEHAGELPEAEVEKIKAHLESEYRRPIRIQLHAKPDLIAGLRIRIGDDVIDNTVKNRLIHFQNQVR